MAACEHPTSRPPPRTRRRTHAAAGATRPPVGELLAGRYRIAGLAGSGATGAVWQARDEMLARDVAVKRLPERQSRGLAEARIGARVRHPNVAAVHDVVRHDESLWLVMDHYPGGTLGALLHDRRRLPAPVTAALGLQLLSALDAVHAAGIVHCDVKPANLLLCGDGRLVLIDFGIAEANGVAPLHPARKEGALVGSPAYMAPEVVRGEAPRPPADLWSLGATLYAAVEGRPPFPRGDAAATLAAVLHDPPAVPRLAGRLASLLTRLLSKDPPRRPSSGAVRAALTDICPPPPALATAGRTARGAPPAASRSHRIGAGG